MRSPDRIWINKVHGQHPGDWDFTSDVTDYAKRDIAKKVEYRRADLPPTLSAAMQLPEVQALVSQYEMLLEDLTEHGGYTYEDDFGADLAALAAIKEQKT